MMPGINCISISKVSTSDWSEEELDAEYGTVKARKGMVSLMVRDIIMENTSNRRPITQERIREILEDFPYSISVDHKSVSRILTTLCNEYPYIRKNESGAAWFDRSKKVFFGGQAA